MAINQNLHPLARTARPGRRGAAAVELAVCLPILVLLVVGAIEACSMVFLKQSLSVAAYEGVRVAISDEATADDVRAACEQLLLDRKIEGGTVTVSPSDIARLNPGEFVDVTVTAPCDGNTVVPNAFYQDKTLSATASMMIEL